MNAHDLEQQMDHDIDRVLRELSSPPPAHLEQRVLATLAQRQTQSEEHASPRRLWLTSPRLSWAVASVAAAAVLAASAIVPRMHREPQQIATHVQPASTQPAALPQIADTLSESPIAPAPFVPMHQTLRHGSVVVRPALEASLDPTTDPATCHCDPVAIAEASAPSHPAPPVPLTREERHMLMLVRSGEPQQLAVLDPNLRDLDFQRERTDFNRFFETSQTKPTLPTNATKQGNDQP